MKKSNLEERFINNRRELFDKIYSSLNNKQREAVYKTDGPLLVLAGASSGKTTVLVHHVAHLIKYGNIYYDSDIQFEITEDDVERLEQAKELEPDEIREVLNEYNAKDHCPAWAVMSITFTNKAANEMKNRLSKVIGETAEEIWAGTFHSICMRILRKYAVNAGYKSGFTIYDTDDSKKVVQACFKTLNIDEKILPVKSVMNQISRAKDRLIEPDEFEIEAGNDFKLKQIASVYTLYQKILKDANVVDFDDIILQTVKLLETDDEVRRYYQYRFKYICVDEFQDTNHAQYKLIKILSGK
ncbi:MAG: UvrD-helicase domain-containing protein, partial [Oscillospiraceae bacterium]|nr:UvrD-helicase domain-containing protein [Oscillospiraceae bacterium]